METPEEIENLRVEKLKKVNETRGTMEIILREIHDHEAKLLELKEHRRLARKLIAELNTDIEILVSKYWSSKRL